MTQLRKMMLGGIPTSKLLADYRNGVPQKQWRTSPKYFHKSSDQLGLDEIRAYHVYLLEERKQCARTVRNHTAAYASSSARRSTGSCFAKRCLSVLPPRLGPVLKPLLEQVHLMSEKIKAYDQLIAKMAKVNYPELVRLTRSMEWARLRHLRSY